jgi:transcription elongation factor Elf1
LKIIKIGRRNLMNDFDIKITCKHCGSTNISVKAIDVYDGDIILSFVCDNCEISETWGVLNETE